MTSSDPMRTYYAERAPEYDRIYAKPERQADLRSMERWVAEALGGRAVLEVACGTGYWTQFIAPVATRMLSLDAAPETMRIAEGRVAPGKVEFMVGDAYALPQTRRGFDAGFAGFWISHVPKSRLAAFLSGLHAALDARARVVLLDNRFVAGSSTAISECDAEGNTYQTRTLADGSAHRVLKNFPTESELREATAGMCRDFRYREWQYYWAIEYEVGAT